MGTRRGQALIEFAIVAFVLTLLLAGILAFGLLLVSANVLQQAADVGAQELARHPFDARGTFDQALTASNLFSEADLILQYDADTGEIENQDGVGVDQLPLINRLLLPLYVFDPDLNGGRLRYPGAVVTNPDGDLTVLVPILRHSDNAGAPLPGPEIIAWRKVVEEIVPEADPPTDEGPFAIDSNNFGGLPGPGFVALRINYPYQSAAMVSYLRVDAGGNVLPSNRVISQDVNNVAVVANDDAIDDSEALPTGYTLTPPAGENAAFEASVARGEFGLGEVGAFATDVRPFRKVLSAQGIYRREVLRP